MRTAIGVLEVESVDEIDETEVTPGDARRAGFASKQALLDELSSRDAGSLFRVKLRLAGPDPRVALRKRSRLGAAEREEVERRLARLDSRSPRGPWTRAVLSAIEKRPAVRAADLAARLGRETLDFKRDVRKLKELGLTESLEVGYRLSPRGRALLRERSAR
jgi:hypothetical protein